MQEANTAEGFRAVHRGEEVQGIELTSTRLPVEVLEEEEEEEVVVPERLAFREENSFIMEFLAVEAERNMSLRSSVAVVVVVVEG